MEHLAFLYYLVSFTVGCISIGISLLIYSQYRRQVIGFYVLFLAALALIMASLSARLYGRVSGLQGSRPLLGLAVFFYVSLAFFPLFVIEILRERLPALAALDFFELFSLASYFLLLNSLSIVLSIRYFNQPPYLAGGEPTEHFRRCFGITAREAEVVSLLLQGRSYNRRAPPGWSTTWSRTPCYTSPSAGSSPWAGPATTSPEAGSSFQAEGWCWTRSCTCTSTSPRSCASAWARATATSTCSRLSRKPAPGISAAPRPSSSCAS